MPVGTIDTSKYTRYDLKTLPPTDSEDGGYIMARPLPYGMKLSRRDKATRMSMEQAVGRPGQKNAQVSKIEIDTLSELSAQHDFAYCIGDHNITDENGNKLDFSNPMVLKSLDPRLGSEIERILADINGDDDELYAEDFTNQSTTSSTSGSTEHSSEL